MKKAALFLVLILMLTGTFCLVVVREHETNMMNRLVKSHAVSASNHCRLLGSTGYLQGNTHVFECEPGDVLPTENGGLNFANMDFEEETQSNLFVNVRKLMDACIDPPVDWTKAVAAGAVGRGPLPSFVFTVKSRGKLFLVLEAY